jgi:cation transport ATPase
MPLDKILYFFRKAKEFNETNKQGLQKEAYEHRWKNLLLSFLYLLGMVGMMALGWWKKSLFGWLQWYLFVFSIFFFSAIGMFTLINYLVIILKKK